MNGPEDISGRYNYSNDITSGIRSRTGMILILSCSTIALAFGLSFHFSLVSGQTSILRQFPELLPVVEKLRGLLILNTFGFAAIIIASYWVLARLITSRMFNPLGDLLEGMKKVTRNRYPSISGMVETGPFGDLGNAYNNMLDGLRDRELEEIKDLESCIENLEKKNPERAGAVIREMIVAKKARIDNQKESGTAGDDAGDGTKNDLFMQPV
jgi:hypothetical protein